MLVSYMYENSVTNVHAMRLLADLVMMTMTVQNQHLTDERPAYSATLDLNNAWTFPACTLCDKLSSREISDQLL